MHKTIPQFWQRYYALPEEIQALARKNFALLKANPAHPSLHFKKVSRFWSARVGRNYRALAIKDDGIFIWVWIGPHDEYDRLLG